MQAMEEFGPDAVRSYLAYVGGHFRGDIGMSAPCIFVSYSDGSQKDWSHTQLEKHSNQLKSLLGNSLLRIASARIRTRVSDAKALEHSPASAALLASAHAVAELAEESLSNLEVSEALDHLMELLRLANRTITVLMPWNIKCSPEHAFGCFVASAETLRVAGICLQPFIPDAAKNLLDALGVPEAERTWDFAKQPFAGRSPGYIPITAVKLF